MNRFINRRHFIKNSAVAGAGLAFMPAGIMALAPEKKATVRMGIIAVGLRGQLHLEEMLKRSDVQVVAIADPDKNMLAAAQSLVKKYNKKAPAEYPNGNHDYQNLLKRTDIDAVIIASPWEWHAPQGIDAMKAGKI